MSIVKVSISDIGIAHLFLMSRTAFVAAIFLSSNTGDSRDTHARASVPFLIAVIMGVVV